jgi:hypothetical protein
MKLERRDFLRASTGLALACADPATSLEQVSGELQAGSGTLRLEGKLKSGLLRFEAQDFIDRADRFLVIRGSLDSAELYSATFTYQKDLTAFAIFHDGGHSTTITLCNSEQAKIGRLVVCNDNEIPQIFRIDKNKVTDKDDLKDFLDVDGKTPDLLGKRKPPTFTWLELESVFGSDPALLAFSRGRRSTHHPREEDRLQEWICRLLSMVPGSLLSLSWLGR